MEGQVIGIVPALGLTAFVFVGVAEDEDQSSPSICMKG